MLELLAGAEQLVGGGAHRRDVLLDRGRLAVRVGDGKAAAEVVRGEVAEGRDRLDREPPRLEVEQLRPDVHVQASEVRPRGVREAIDRVRRLLEAEAELRARMAGEDRRVRVGDDPGRDPDHHPRGHRQRVELVDVVEVVDDDQRTGLSGRLQLRRGLRVAVQDDPVALVAGVARQCELAPGGDVDAQPLLLEDPEHRRARERLAGEHDLPVPHRGPELPRAVAQIVLGDGVQRRPELARELERVAPTDRQATGVDARRLGVEVADRSGHEGGDARAQRRAERGGRVKRARCAWSLAGEWARLTRLAAPCLWGSDDRLAPVCPPPAGQR